MPLLPYISLHLAVLPLLFKHQLSVRVWAHIQINSVQGTASLVYVVHTYICSFAVSLRAASLLCHYFYNNIMAFASPDREKQIHSLRSRALFSVG